MRSGKHVFVTGATSGIGEATTRLLAARGYEVLAGTRDPERAEARLLTGGAQAVRVVEIDVTSSESVQGAARRVEELSNGHLYALVNNAGIAVAGPLELVPDEEMARQMEVNVTGQMRVTRALLPLVRAAGQGRIVNVGSTAGRLSTPILGAYSASKHALDSLTETLRVELRPWDIQVILIEPGNIRTPIWEKSSQNLKDLLSRLGAASKPYAGLLEAGLAWMERVEMSPPEEVARVVARALSAPRPRRRYLVGKGAALEAFIARLPGALRERLVLWAFDLD